MFFNPKQHGAMAVISPLHNQPHASVTKTRHTQSTKQRGDVFSSARRTLKSNWSTLHGFSFVFLTSVYKIGFFCTYVKCSLYVVILFSSLLFKLIMIMTKVFHSFLLYPSDQLQVLSDCKLVSFDIVFQLHHSITLSLTITGITTAAGQVKPQLLCHTRGLVTSRARLQVSPSIYYKSTKVALSDEIIIFMVIYYKWMSRC